MNELNTLHSRLIGESVITDNCPITALFFIHHFIIYLVKTEISNFVTNIKVYIVLDSTFGSTYEQPLQDDCLIYRFSADDWKLTRSRMIFFTVNHDKLFRNKNLVAHNS